MRTFKEKMNPNTQFNFNKATEIGHWAKKFGVDAKTFQKAFEQLGCSISKTIAYFSQGQQQKSAA